MTDNPEIIFLFPQEDGNFIYHLGSNYIIAYLRRNGIRAEQFVNDLPLSIGEIVSAILKRAPRIVGFTVYDANYFLVKEFAKKLKQVAPEIILLAGGPTATFSCRDMMKDLPQLDICVRGEGEVAAYELIGQLQAKRNLNKVLGITYRSGTKLINNPARPLLRGNSKHSCLDILPSPYLEGVLNVQDLIRYNSHQVPVLTSRGCFYKCTYCNFSAISRHIVRFHSPERVIAELRILDGFRKKGFGFEVVICDDTFSLHRKRIELICQGLINEGIGLDLVDVELRADRIDERLLRRLFQAGIREINLGLESSSPRVLYNVKKARLGSSTKDRFKLEKTFIKQVKKAVGIAKGIGFKTNVSVIFGLPGDTKKTALETLNFIRNLGVDRYSHNILSIYAGTALARDYTRYGLKKMHRMPGLFPRFISEPILSPLVFPYDLNKIPRLENENNILIQRRYALAWLAKSLGGVYKRHEESFYPEVVFVEGGRFPYTWLKDQGALQTRFIYGSGLDLTSSSITLAVGTNSSYLHPKYGLLTAEELLRYIPDELKVSYHLHFLKDFDRRRKEQRVIFSIRDDEDICQLERLSENGNKKNDISFLGRPQKDHLILDECRWSSSCPALSLWRLIMDGKGNIKVCFDSVSIGRVGDRLHALKERIYNIYEEKIKERSCNNCAVKYTCSKCPFLKPEIEKLYCQVKKGNPSVGHFINSFQLARKINYLCLSEDERY